MRNSIKNLFDGQIDLVYFDHGGYSLPFKDVVGYQYDLNGRINRNPSQFFRYELMHELAIVRCILADFLQCRAENLCFLTNATYALATILKNVDLGPGDAVLIPSLSYHGTRKALQQLSHQLKFEIIEAPIDLPVMSSADLLEAIKQAYNPKVRLAIIDHISSPTSIIFPVQEICEYLRSQGVTTVVDGAQSPGQIPVVLRELSCDFFIGNGHKWLTGPRTSSFLYIADGWTNRMRGLINARADDFPAAGRTRIQMETDWPGAYDPVPLLCLPKALEQLKSLYPGSLSQLYRENHQGVQAGLQILATKISVTPLADSSLFGSMATVQLNDSFKLPARELQSQLFAEGVAIQVYPGPGSENLSMRVCHQAYIDAEGYLKLVEILARYVSS